jgi:ATP-binding cassette subfamily B protein
MKILLQYLKPYKLLVVLVLFLAAVNIGFSLMDPIIFGKLVDLANYQGDTPFNWNDFFTSILLW